MSATLLIANPGRKGKKRFVLRRGKPRSHSVRAGKRRSAAQKAATLRMIAALKAKKAGSASKKARTNSWSERATFPILKAPRHRTAALLGIRRKSKASKKRPAKARRNPRPRMVAPSTGSIVKELRALRAKISRKPRKNPGEKTPVTARVVGASAKPREEKKMAKKHKKGGKKRRSAAQKAATAKMIAANKSHKSGKKGKKKGRKKARTAAQKAATRKMIAANKHGGKKHSKKRGKKRKSHKRSKTASKLTRTLKALIAGAKRSKGKKGKAASRARAVSRGRRAGIRARLSGASSATLKRYGLSRVNPGSIKSLAKDAWALAPQFGVAAAAFAAVSVLGSPQVLAKLPDAIKNLWKGKDEVETAKRAAWLPVVGGVLAAVAGYIGIRMTKASKYAAPVAFGGIAGAALYALAAVKVKDKDGVEITLAKRLGLPIGEYVSVAGYVDVGGGRMMSVNGLGEYVSVAGIHEMALPGGQMMRYEGAMHGLGEYVYDPVGLSGGIFPGAGELVDHTQSQVPLRRDPTWGLRGDPEGNVNIRALLSEGEGMSGGIFDRNR